MTGSRFFTLLLQTSTRTKTIFRILVQLFSGFRTWPPSTNKMTVKKEMGSVILKFVSNGGNEDLGLDLTPLQNS